MTTVDPAAPSAGPASPAARVLAQARFEATTLLRNGEQLLVAVLLPAAVLVGLVHARSISLGDGRRVDLAVPGVLALCVISSAFTGQAISTGFDRRYGVLRLLGVTPLGRTGLVLAKAVAVLAVIAVQVALIGALGAVLGWEPALRGIPAAVVALVLGTWAFTALALLLGGTLRAEGVLAVANLVWVALLGLGGVVVAGTELPDGFAAVLTVLPSAALGDSLRAALVDGQAAPGAWLVLLGWAVGATLLARRFFRWGD
ncbi:ABC transporter permease [Pedococcus bigeumensis]|jgi:ABC-2 type transport system permease protein|uniref:ABC transporter permease n=1 Tax=Pedococcus bigeumensis TaxID=433644 RepID=UPI002FE74835